MPKPHAITVYLGSSGYARPVFIQQARALGELLASSNIKTIYGGMNAGSMRALANGALEAGGEVIGVIPQKIKDSERVHNGLTELIAIPGMWERKQIMFGLADEIWVLPGGYGTLDEALEILYWSALGLHNKKLVFLDSEGYWAPIASFLEGLGVRNVEFKVVLPETITVESARPAAQDVTHYPHFETEILQATRTPIIIDQPDVKNAYRLMSALVLRQLGAHDRPIGLLNKEGCYDDIVAWVDLARKEKFITAQCPNLMAVAKTEKGLMQKLERYEEIVIDVQRDKWGK